MKVNEKHLIHFASTKDGVDLVGWLWKKSEGTSSFHKRWCILKGNLFFYYEKKNDKEPVGFIILENFIVQLSDASPTKFAFSIQFLGNDCRVYNFAAKNEENCTTWVKALSSSSYRYLEILVQSLEKDIGNTKLKSGLVEQSQLKGSDNNISEISLSEVEDKQRFANNVDDDNVRDDSSFSFAGHPQHLLKSNSLNDVVETGDVLKNLDVSCVLPYIHSETKLSRARSSCEISGMVDRLPPVINSVSISNSLNDTVETGDVLKSLNVPGVLPYMHSETKMSRARSSCEISDMVDKLPPVINSFSTTNLKSPKAKQKRIKMKSIKRIVSTKNRNGSYSSISKKDSPPLNINFVTDHFIINTSDTFVPLSDDKLVFLKMHQSFREEIAAFVSVESA